MAVLEAHGTGTALGDPIEAGSMAAVLLSGRASPLAAGSLKANAGHTEPGAGLAGALRLLMQLRAACVSPNAQLRLVSRLVVQSVQPSAFALPLDSHSCRELRQCGVTA